MINFLTIPSGNGSIEHTRSLLNGNISEEFTEMLLFNPEQAKKFLALTIQNVAREGYVPGLSFEDYAVNYNDNFGFTPITKTGSTRKNNDIPRNEQGLICSFYA